MIGQANLPRALATAPKTIRKLRPGIGEAAFLGSRIVHGIGR